MILKSPYNHEKITDILTNEIDAYPTFLRCLISLNAFYFLGSSPVCGVVKESSFELRNRRGHHFSLRAFGTLVSSKKDVGSLINIDFKDSIFPDLIGIVTNRYQTDEKIIIDFLKDCLKAKQLLNNFC